MQNLKKVKASRRPILRPIFNTKGQGLVEYAFILALIAVACILALTVLRDAITDQLDTISSIMTPG